MVDQWRQYEVDGVPEHLRFGHTDYNGVYDVEYVKHESNN